MIQQSTHLIGPTRPFLETAESYRLTPRDTAIRGGLALLALVIGLALTGGALACLGALIRLLLNERYDAPTGMDLLFSCAGWIAFGAALFASGWWCLAWSHTMRLTLIDAMTNYNQAVADWHRVSIEAYTSRRGVTEQRTYTRIDLDPTRPADFIAAGVALWLLLESDANARPSIDTLKRGLFIGDEQGLVRVGTFTERDGAAFLNALALSEDGIIQGRGQKRAGRLRDMQPEEYLRRIAAAARKLQGTEGV